MLCGEWPCVVPVTSWAADCGTLSIHISLAIPLFMSLPLQWSNADYCFTLKEPISCMGFSKEIVTLYNSIRAIPLSEVTGYEHTFLFPQLWGAFWGSVVTFWPLKPLEDWCCQWTQHLQCFRGEVMWGHVTTSIGSICIAIHGAADIDHLLVT